MLPTPRYCAAVCIECRQAAVVLDDPAIAHFCANCGTRSRKVPTSTMAAADVPRFLALERIVSRADLSRSEAALLAAELEAVSSRWDAPASVLTQLSARLEGLMELCEVMPDYSQQLLLVDMLLTTVAARMLGERAAERRIPHRSGLRPAAREDAVPLRLPRPSKLKER
jgi:hypothetical protein